MLRQVKLFPGTDASVDLCSANPNIDNGIFKPASKLVVKHLFFYLREVVAYAVRYQDTLRAASSMVFRLE